MLSSFGDGSLILDAGSDAQFVGCCWTSCVAELTFGRRWDLELLDGFKVARKADEEGFKSGGFEQTLGGQRRLLWHGYVVSVGA